MNNKSKEKIINQKNSKKFNYNPGTCADLTVTTLLMDKITDKVISKEDSITVVNIFSKYKTPFLELMMKKELEIEFPESIKYIMILSMQRYAMKLKISLIKSS